jgi:hypothetical protein
MAMSRLAALGIADWQSELPLAFVETRRIRPAGVLKPWVAEATMRALHADYRHAQDRAGIRRRTMF